MRRRYKPLPGRFLGAEETVEESLQLVLESQASYLDVRLRLLEDDGTPESMFWLLDFREVEELVALLAGTGSPRLRVLAEQWSAALESHLLHPDT